MHLRILPDHQKLFFRIDNFDRLQWLKTCFDSFSHTSRSPETLFQKRYFLPSGAVTNVFFCFCAYFQTTRNFFQKRYFWTSAVVKNVFWCICAYFQTTKIYFSKKIFLTVWSGYKTCCGAFLHFRRSPETFFEKRYFLPSGVVKNVFWCISTYFQTKIDFFWCLEWLGTCFDAFAHTSRPPETFFQKRYFLLSGAITNVFFLRLRILPDHKKLFFKKDIFDRLQWLKTCFDLILHNSRSPETIWSG